MSDFKKFFSERTERSALPSREQSESAVSSAVETLLQSAPRLAAIDSDRKKEFAEKVSRLAYSDEFIEDLSDRIADPLPEESEDEFVARAKAAVRVLIAKKLKA
jgi:hypothetical protein